MPASIVPLPGKGALFLIGATSYRFTRWSLTFTLGIGEVMHFDSQVDANNNAWPTVFGNFASGEGSAGGAVDHSWNPIPIGPGLYINSTGTAYFMHYGTAGGASDGFIAPIIIKGNEMSSDASSQDPAQRSISFTLTGPPTRSYG